MIPVPFLACEVGWLVAELGRQPWTVSACLPTWICRLHPQRRLHVFSLIGFVGL